MSINLHFKLYQRKYVRKSSIGAVKTRGRKFSEYDDAFIRFHFVRTIDLPYLRLDRHQSEFEEILIFIPCSLGLGFTWLSRGNS